MASSRTTSVTGDRAPRCRYANASPGSATPSRRLRRDHARGHRRGEAGALGSIAEGEEPLDPAFTVAYLKRALDHLHKTQAALEAVAAKPAKTGEAPLLPEAVLARARQDLFEIRQEILCLMQVYRDKK